MNPIITLGIQTYRRPEALCSILDQVRNIKVLRDHCDVLIIDDSAKEEH